MADEADKSATGNVTTPGDEKRDETTPQGVGDKPPGTYGDTPKKKRGRPYGSKNKPKVEAGSPTVEGRSKAWLTKRLSALLRSPGFVFEATGDPWAVEHIDTAGPTLAKALADHAERNPAFKSRLVAFLDGGETAGLILASIMYAAPLAIYFGILPIPSHFRARLPIPERGATTVPVGVPPVPGANGAPSQEALEAEAKAKGFDDLGDYLNAVQNAIADIQGPGVTSP